MSHLILFVCYVFVFSVEHFLVTNDWYKKSCTCTVVIYFFKGLKLNLSFNLRAVICSEIFLWYIYTIQNISDESNDTNCHWDKINQPGWICILYNISIKPAHFYLNFYLLFTNNLFWVYFFSLGWTITLVTTTKTTSPLRNWPLAVESVNSRPNRSHNGSNISANSHNEDRFAKSEWRKLSSKKN